MDVADLFNERRADVAAFAALLFQRGSESSKHRTCTPSPHNTHASTTTKSAGTTTRVKALANGSSAPTLLTSSTSHTSFTLAYRRPASANVPVSRVLYEVKARAARRQRLKAGQARVKGKKAPFAGEQAAAAAAHAHAQDGALGFTAQQLREHAYLWMSSAQAVHRTTAFQLVSREAAKQSATLTPKQQAQLRRLRIRQKHMRLLSYAQWQLWLRRRRRLWQRRRPTTRQRHLRRCLALQYGRPLAPCSCCAVRKTCKTRGSARATKKRKAKSSKLALASPSCVAQWLPTHARLVKRFHHRVVSLVVPLDVTHATDQHGGASAADLTRSVQTLHPRKPKAMSIARVSVPMEPKRKGHRFLQRWATELGLQQRRRSSKASGATAVGDGKGVPRPPAALDRTLIADLSHQCVYQIERRGAAGVGAPVLSSLTLDTIAQLIGLRAQPSSSSSSSTTITAAVAPAAGGSEDGVVFEVEPTAHHRRTHMCAASVRHGYMWSATEDSRAVALTRSGGSCGGRGRGRSRRRVSTLARHTRVVPVVLVCYTEATAARFLLFSEAPVLVSRRAAGLLKVQLISAWNPCSRCPAFASVYEYWRWDSSTASPSAASSSLSLTTRRAALPVKNVLRRCTRVYCQLRRLASPTRTPHRTRQKMKAKGKATARTARQRPPHRQMADTAAPQLAPRRRQTHAMPRVSAVVFPSLPDPFLCTTPQREEEPLKQQGQRDEACGHASLPYVWRVALIHQRGKRGSFRAFSATQRAVETARSDTPSTTEREISRSVSAATKKARETAQARQLYHASVRARRTHFHLARRFFGLLLSTSFTPASAALSDRRALTRVLGLSERATLLRLVGQPAYPLDYGQSRPSAASQRRSRIRQRSSAKCLVTRSGAKRAHCSAFPEDHEASELGAVLHQDSKSHRPHAVTSIPSYVHLLEYYGNPTNAGCRVTVRSAHAGRKMPTLHSTVGSVLLRCWCTASHAETVVERVGVVSSSPFFAQRFGCMVASVWCCFSPTHAPSSDFALATQGAPSAQQSSSGWMHKSLFPTAQSHVRMWFVLAPPEAAATLLQLSALLQRERPPRKRAASRRQRALDLSRGRTARQLEALVCDPVFCSPVQLIYWYV